MRETRGKKRGYSMDQERVRSEEGARVIKGKAKKKKVTKNAYTTRANLP